jgi:hypothetical protein
MRTFVTSALALTLVAAAATTAFAASDTSGRSDRQLGSATYATGSYQTPSAGYIVVRPSTTPHAIETPVQGEVETFQSSNR